jgi:hypothetical protein
MWIHQVNYLEFLLFTVLSHVLSIIQKVRRCLEIYNKLRSNAAQYNVQESSGFYMSVLEHEWFILVHSESAHGIEHLCIESGISTFNTVKIVPLTNYQDVLERIQN